MGKLRCPSGCLASDEIIAMSRGALTHRQLTYWTNALGVVSGWFHHRNGLHVERAGPDADSGTGYALGWSPREAERAVHAAEIIAAAKDGVPGNNLPVPFALALADGELTFTLPGGRTLTMTARFSDPGSMAGQERQWTSA